MPRGRPKKALATMDQEETILTINDTNGNGAKPADVEEYTPSLEERAREFRTGKRIISIPGGGSAIVRLPSSQELDDSETQMSIALFKLKKQGVPFLAQLTEHLDDTVDKDRLNAITHDEKMNFMEKAQAFETLLSDSFAMGLVNHTAEARAQVVKWNYLLERCVLNDAGENFWEASEFGSFDEYPSNAVSRHIMTEWYRFFGDSQNPLFSSESPKPPATGSFAGDSASTSTEDQPDPGMPVLVN